MPTENPPLLEPKEMPKPERFPFPRGGAFGARRDIDVAGRIQRDVIRRGDLRAENVDIGLAGLERYISPSRKHRCHIQRGGTAATLLFRAPERNEAVARADEEARFLARDFKLMLLGRTDD